MKFTSRGPDCRVALELGWRLMLDHRGWCPAGQTGGVDWDAPEGQVRLVERGSYDEILRGLTDSTYEVVSTGRRFTVVHGSPRFLPAIRWSGNHDGN